MSLERIIRWAQHMIIDLWAHHGFAIWYERLPAWAKVTAGIVSAGLVVGGFVALKAKRGHFPAGGPAETWVKRGDKIIKAENERFIRIIEISDDDPHNGRGSL